MKNALKAAALAALMSLGVAAQADTTVDLFNTPQTRLTDDTIGGPVVTSQVGSALDTTILGGYRELFVEKKSDIPGGDGEAKISVAGGVLNFSTDSTVTGTGTVRWDGVSAGGAINTTGLGGVNLGNPFSDSFQLMTVFSDAGFKFVIEAYTNATQWSKVQLVSNAHPLSLPGTVTNIPLLAFLDCGFNNGTIIVTCGGGGAVDFTNLGALQAVIDPFGEFTSLDLSLNQIRVVPEPSSIALVGLALLGGFAATRRRKA